MKKLYVDEIELANQMSDSDKFNYLTSVLRSLLQTICISLFEITKEYTPSDETDLSNLIERFLKPVDGLCIDVVNGLLPTLRTYHNSRFLDGYFESISSINPSLSEQLLNWVEFRNKRQGHGVINPEIAKEGAKKTQTLIANCLVVFNHSIPTLEQDGSPKLGKILVSIPLLHNNKPIVINRITLKKGLWKLKGQVLSVFESDEFTVELNQKNIFSNGITNNKNRYDLIEIYSSKNNKSVSIFHNIPQRQTDTFVGRENEIKLLTEWIDDEDSRYCLVYGDGGYGKTTLVLEFFNRLLESQYDFERNLPTIVSYQTAKKTKWTENGLVHLTSASPIMDECLRELARFFIEVLPPDWYQASGRQLVDKSLSLIKDYGLTRDDILLIMDNTETLATTPEEVAELGEFFKNVGKRVGRVIITSRRREFIEASPVPVKGLSESEAISLMKNLAKDYYASPIMQAGDSTLRKVANQLMLKPLLIEVLVKYIAHSKQGISTAIDAVHRKTSDELLQFLYEDAWLRMNDLQKDVFLALINITSPIEQNSVSKTCQEVGIQQSEFLSGLEETHFSITTDKGANYSIELVTLARRFFEQQFSKLDEIKKNTLKSIAESVDRYARELQSTEREYKKDRVAEAFRNEYAKAAKVYADKGENRNAIEMYELAITDDPLNSALHDRFSFFLLNKVNNPQYAKEISWKAIHLDANNCDALVGYAMVCNRLGEIEEHDKYIDKAGNIDRSPTFCNLRKGIVRYHKASNSDNLRIKAELLLEAEKFLKKAKQFYNNKSGYDAKNQEEILKYQNNIAYQLSIIRAKITGSIKD